MNHDYASKKLNSLLNDLDLYTADEFKNQMLRIISGSTGLDIESQLESIKRERVIAKEINDALMDKSKKLEEEIKSVNGPFNENIVLKRAELNIEALEVAAKSLFESEPHRLLAAAGYPTKWEDQCSSIKRDMLRKVRTAVIAYLDKAGEA